MSDGEEVRCVGKLFHRLAARTGKARLLTVARLKDGITDRQTDRQIDRQTDR